MTSSNNILTENLNLLLSSIYSYESSQLIFPVTHQAAFFMIIFKRTKKVKVLFFQSVNYRFTLTLLQRHRHSVHLRDCVWYWAHNMKFGPRCIKYLFIWHGNCEKKSIINNEGRKILYFNFHTVNSNYLIDFLHYCLIEWKLVCFNLD